jgi:hypothetical protein
MANDEGMRVPDFKSHRRDSGRSEAQWSLQLGGQSRPGQDFDPVATPSANSAGSFDFGQDDRSSFEGGSFVICHF